MSTQPVDLEQVEAPVVEPVAPPEPPKQKIRRVIQPVDDKGSPLGNPHVYEADSEQEMIDKLSAAVGNGTYKIRDLSLKAKTGGLEVPKAPEGAELDEDIPEVRPVDLSDEELLQLSQDIKDPRKMRSAFSRLYEAETGLKPEKEASARVKLMRQERSAEAKRNSEAFVNSHPEYYTCKANQDAMIGYMASRNLRWTLKNLELALTELKADGLLVDAPEEAPVVEVPAPKVQEPAPEIPETRTEASEPPAVRKQQSAFPSAIKPSTASGPSGPAKPKRPTAADVARMSAKEYKAYVIDSESRGLPYLALS
jgi:hypothetical protein